MNLKSPHLPARPGLFWRIARQVRPCWPNFAALFLLSLLAPPLALLSPLPLKIAFDNILDSRPLPGFIQAITPGALTSSTTGRIIMVAGLVVLVAFLTHLRESGSQVLSTYTAEKLVRRFRADLFRHVQRLSLAYHDTHGTSDSTYRIQYDAMSLQNIAVEGLVPSVTSALTFLSMIYVTLRINWQLGLVALAVSPLLFFISRYYRRRLRQQSREMRKLDSSALSVVHEALGAARVVKAFGQQNREEQRFVQRSNQGMYARVRVAMMSGSFGILVGVLTSSGIAAVLVLGLEGIQSGTLTRGDLLLVMGYLAHLYHPLKTIGKKMSNLQNHLAGAERAFALLDQEPDVIERPAARRLPRASGHIEFRQVCFAYNPERPILRDISFEVLPGTCLGLAGTTGAGKTTLVNLIMRFYDPTAGTILLDGFDLRDYKLADLRDQFALVLQEPVLFSTSIGENIAYARPRASEAEIIAAAQAANADAFIRRLPDGYGTLVGERGLCLSGGERQRISIARAFLKNAPVLILDEPTSSVDVHTEAAIVQAMERLMQGRTTVIIAHRPSTLKHCDAILRVEQGRILEPAAYAVGTRAATPIPNVQVNDRGQAYVEPNN